MRNLIIALSLFLLPLATTSFGQGCSDAGACSIGDIKSVGKNADSIRNNSIGIGINYGAGFEKTNSITPYIEYERVLCKYFSLQAKLTAAFISGDLGDNSGLGDIFISGNYRINPYSRNHFSIIAGVKIPLTDADAKNDQDIPLPMDYQSSLGTFDIIAGLAYNMGRNFEMALAAQLPLTKANKNEFFPYLFENGNANKFAVTNKFERQPDVLIRAAYSINVNDKFSIKPGILAIYHVSEDKFTDLVGQNRTIEDSDGLTLNLNVTATYRTNDYSQFELLIAAPAAVRKVRPDGLTRSFVLGLQYRMGF